jgi:hypothetical protein
VTPIYFLLDAPGKVPVLIDLIKRSAGAVREHPLEVVIRRPRKEKSASQRGLWHAMLADMAKEMGYTPAEMKQVVKAEYYGTTRIKLASGHVVEVVPSSEEEDREGYGRLIDFTLRLAAENGIILQDRRSTYGEHDVQNPAV